MAKRRSTEKIDRFPERRGIANRIYTMLRARTLGMSPFPFAPMQFYELVWGEERLKMIDALPGDLFEKDLIFRVGIVRPAPNGGVYRWGMNLTLPESRVKFRGYTQYTLTEDMLPEREWKALVDWGTIRIKCHSEGEVANTALTALLNTAVTMGQVRTFWPTLEQFMRPETQREIALIKRSKVSENMLRAWSAATRFSTREIDAMLGEALMFDDMDTSSPAQLNGI